MLCMFPICSAAMPKDGGPKRSVQEIARPYELADGKPGNAGQINVEGVDDKVPKGKYPKVTKKVGKSPPQYLDEDE